MIRLRRSLFSIKVSLIALLSLTIVLNITTRPTSSSAPDHTTTDVSLLRSIVRRIFGSGSLSRGLSVGGAKIRVALSGCGSSLMLALNAVKSILISTNGNSRISVFFFTEKRNHQYVRRRYQYFSQSAAWKGNLFLHVLAPTFPGMNTSADKRRWMAMWKPCASQRLFLPDILASEDSIIYVDADIVFLGAVEDLWRQFEEMNETQAIAMANEHEIGMESEAYYNRHSKLPFFVPPLGVNSGVLLMNLTRLRSSNFTWEIIRSYTKYQQKLNFHDQDLLNIYLYEHPENFYRLNCSWNYRMSHCINDTNNCHSAGTDGVRLLHGNRNAFTTRTMAEFRFIGDSISQFTNVGKFTTSQLLNILSAVVYDVDGDRTYYRR
ncbi:putative Glucoside xylosyltransferase 2 [Hypsibius exemplaris]|uniref:UDP-D-xylose:beta-D-glucoside alpha-1,3-D-xylosyltransferase n=1 Tax=Hypsibius exemplaris TaxID=2072580 RepID=A0A9X6RK66_HYPEX|nr:putative Glucoside xylosyltransferase 2 [Hypsibius exemplaris]